ncbi:uncharacterized protein PAN0_004c2324 [Moesziomyces antarcticus]|uniref:Uncharacterized protein n=2 Tax=Pseudozyma antarctica TaxID=84753 RepID=A0A5C3FLL8_PSEA2|nr:uncharacterized protein PAN0_004c2324 [Moesziomyces antarcticus]GAK64115.1 hypothetical protein PAN0_004c2324 [Moesziomyces antarcticus]SPO44665.1 uncharacterized protein PSANT_02350 [Moesziomyces antarcticus]
MLTQPKQSPHSTHYSKTPSLQDTIKVALSNPNLTLPNALRGKSSSSRIQATETTISPFLPLHVQTVNSHDSNKDEPDMSVDPDTTKSRGTARGAVNAIKICTSRLRTKSLIRVDKIKPLSTRLLVSQAHSTNNIDQAASITDHLEHAFDRPLTFAKTQIPSSAARPSPRSPRFIPVEK